MNELDLVKGTPEWFFKYNCDRCVCTDNKKTCELDTYKNKKVYEGQTNCEHFVCRYGSQSILSIDLNYGKTTSSKNVKLAIEFPRFRTTIICTNFIHKFRFDRKFSMGILVINFLWFSTIIEKNIFRKNFGDHREQLL